MRALNDFSRNRAWQKHFRVLVNAMMKKPSARLGLVYLLLLRGFLAPIDFVLHEFL